MPSAWNRNIVENVPRIKHFLFFGGVLFFVLFFFPIESLLDLRGAYTFHAQPELHTQRSHGVIQIQSRLRLHSALSVALC
jgi:hypothetical protein